MDELNYTVMFPFERNFDPVPSTVWMQTYWAHSITVSVFYAFAIHQGVKWMEGRPALALDGPLIVWNALLALFSIFGFLRMTPEFFYSLFYGGFEYSVCNSSYAKGVTGFWTEMFALSKLFELGDTAFIVLRKRPLIFLHWYHHITVLVYTWHAYKDHTAAGRWFVWMNYFVHSFMYTYYMARAMRFRPVKWIPMGITILQITQMVIGCFVVITAYMVKQSGKFCQQTFSNLYFSFLIYASYFLLFAHFFYRTYLKSHRKFAATITTTTTTTATSTTANGMVSSNGFIRKSIKAE
ncbi:putative fatty acid elongation protein 3 [Trichinella pseudospiralis]|nr:putative fatty acid elongation protein 3 [Trichinella pseudospiralis]KRZ30012.1 putative fatty acid elongation protein 3 [Trichinella pseudospiralis]